MPSDVVELTGAGADSAQSVAGSDLDPSVKIILIVVIVVLVLVGIAAICYEKNSKNSSPYEGDKEAGWTDDTTLLESKAMPSTRKGYNPVNGPEHFSITEFAASNPIAPPASPYFREEQADGPPEHPKPDSQPETRANP